MELFARPAGATISCRAEKLAFYTKIRTECRFTPAYASYSSRVREFRKAAQEPVAYVHAQSSAEDQPMFEFFRRSTAAPAKSSAKTATRTATRTSARVPGVADPAPLPQVVEGNEHSDWALWEDSVMLLDSQMQALTPSARIYERQKDAPSEYQDVDPFAKIGKKSA